MKQWLKASPPALRPVLIGYFVLMLVFLASLAVTAALFLVVFMGTSFRPPPWAVYVLFLPIVTYLALRLYQNSMLAPLAVFVNATGDVDAPIGGNRRADEGKIKAALDAFDALGGPAMPWVDDGVQDWLQTPEGTERDRKRNALLERLYAYAATSSDDHARRAAANRLRLAINPWVDD